ncbi:methionine--tRNA ligase [Dictyoglomus thermophilum]|uniref:Methionine--tRNA ligase n=1 Tax=Dictyoglomus thermophilum (strain ATCC 35947 / DSM 3960 / H-6-12) TaxID=309799 RepID=B5YCC6_DICT6|nr:methionine--tRNA ligase [Dictyoglomus thermophilum]ACI18261.1 methionyl-tRNA synthetase [Dictyoglomus thermophilum H-6-12]
MRNKFYITTPIYYSNSEPHIGTVYTTIVADTFARFYRLKDYDVFFLTGLDEHGQKLARTAQEKGYMPQEYVDMMAQKFLETWKKIGITNDDFIRTTQKRHEEVVQKVFQKLYDEGYLYKGSYAGWYCTPCETFWQKEDLHDGNCPSCGRPVEWLEEETYYFKLSAFAEPLLKYIEEHPEFVYPETRRNEVISFIKSGLKDISATRTTVKWGVPVPFDPKHTVYVWFDALVNYISALGYLTNDDTKFKRYWPADIHLIGKDILRFHAIIWPAILMALNIPLPKTVLAHGFWTIKGGKISKSKGNRVDPHELINLYGVDALRYFLLREVPLGLDGEYSDEAFHRRYHSDLANDLGNLVNRVLTVAEKYTEGKVPEPKEFKEEDTYLLQKGEDVANKVEEAMANFNPANALTQIWEVIQEANRYIDQQAPWNLASSGDNDRLNTVIYTLLETLRKISIMLYAFIPNTAEEIQRQLGYKDVQFAWDLIKDVKIPVGQKLNKGKILFPRVERKEEKEVAEEKKEEPKITIEEFKKIDLRIARVISARKVENSDKLLLLEIDLGDEKRQIVAGIAEYYKPEELIGKEIVVVYNLQPAKIRGYESQGMLLAAKDNKGRLAILTPEKEVDPGSKVS